MFEPVTPSANIVDKILKTPEIEAAYSQNPEGFEIRQYEITAWYKSKNPAGFEDSDMGGKLLSVDSLYHIPETENLQISVKFNLDILRDRQTEYSSELLPFRFYLEDENLEKYTEISAVEYDERYSFGYIRLNFDGVVLEKDTLDEYGEPERKNYEMYLEMKKPDGTYEPYESFSIYTGSKNSRLVTYK